MSNLQELQLIYCNVLTENCIEFIAQVPQLLFIVLPPCTSDSSLKYLEACSHLEYISFVGCHNISKEGVKKLYEYIKPCAIHHFQT